jgi:hypothetical protein
VADGAVAGAATPFFPRTADAEAFFFDLAPFSSTKSPSSPSCSLSSSFVFPFRWLAVSASAVLGRLLVDLPEGGVGHAGSLSSRFRLAGADDRLVGVVVDDDVAVAVVVVVIRSEDDDANTPDEALSLNSDTNDS